ncbi:MAG: hypothetical protein KGM93_05735 [Sphingomonadales bacterium]|nr:hypothetical protein [Sphingomonadales bacterium]
MALFPRLFSLQKMEWHGWLSCRYVYICVNHKPGTKLPAKGKAFLRAGPSHRG